MKLVFKIISLFVAIFFCSQANAQRSKTFPGFYITPTGDTVKGVFPNYTQWSKNPVRVAFISSSASLPIALTPENCLKFSIENYDEYLAFSGQRLENSIDDNQIMRSPQSETFDEQYETISVFVRRVAKTTGCELYMLSDSKRINYFYKLPGQALVELKYQKRYDQNRIFEFPGYRQQLNRLFYDEVTKRNLTKLLEGLPYTEAAMANFFKKLYPVAKAKNKTRNTAAGWVLSAGVSINQMKLKGDKSIDKVGRDYSSSFSPLISLGYILPISRNFNRYFIYPQVKVFSYKISGERSNGTFLKRSTFQASPVVVGEINGGMNVLNKEDLRVFITGGAGMMLLVKNREADQVYTVAGNSLYTSAKSDLAKATYTLNMSAGVILKNKMMVSTTYHFPTPVGNYVYYSHLLSSIQVKLGYKF